MNKITCICVGVKDMERSIKFYRDGLGYKGVQVGRRAVS